MYRQLVHKENLNTTDILVADIGPGTNKAVLTTSDGASITLEGENGEILIGADAITYTDGTPVHTGHSADPEKRAIQNMLRTPKAGQYHIVLSDGTKVWLNAFSLLKFPSQFIGDERLVELTGEAYFEVSPDKKKPFKVKSQGQIIEVLGTHFNVSAYTGERTATTLVEGRVRVSDFAGTGSVVLKPHQQSVLAANSTKIHIADVDTESALAWKNGYFIFDDEGLESIMKKIERWYDVEVIYEAKVRKIEFLGRVSRSKNISSVLKALEQAGNLKFKLDGRRLRIIE